jgi:hypothetical protein
MGMGHHKDDKRLSGAKHLHYRVEEIGSLKWTWRREAAPPASPPPAPHKKKKPA